MFLRECLATPPIFSNDLGYSTVALINLHDSALLLPSRPGPALGRASFSLNMLLHVGFYTHYERIGLLVASVPFRGAQGCTGLVLLS